MRKIIQPTLLKGTVPAVASKSQAHRAIFLAAFADRPTRIFCADIPEDIAASLRAVEMLGAACAQEEGVITVTPADRSRPVSEMKRFDCGESGTTLRFVLPMIGVRAMTANIRTHGRLGTRPLKELGRELTKNGMAFDQTGISTEALGKLRAGSYELPGDVSSQYVSALLMALPLLDGPSEIVIEGELSSSAYVDMTLDMMRRFGVSIQRQDDRFLIEPAERYLSPGEVAVEGDWSAAAFWMAARELGSDVSVSGMNEDSVQGDRAAEALLARISAGNAEIDIDPTPDLLPVLAATAAVTEGRTCFVHAARLRDKESDRLETTAAMIRALGGDCEAGEDHLIVSGIAGGKLTGGTVDAAADHRIAMSAAIAATVCENDVIINGAEAVGKSYPRFWEDYAALGGVLTDMEDQSAGLSRDF